jgi:hypothetical protein
MRSDALGSASEVIVPASSRSCVSGFFHHTIPFPGISVLESAPVSVISESTWLFASSAGIAFVALKRLVFAICVVFSPIPDKSASLPECTDDGLSTPNSRGSSSSEYPPSGVSPSPAAVLKLSAALAVLRGCCFV